MSSALRFGQHTLHPQARTLEAAGHPVALGARAYDVLVALVERRDRVVTKGELLDVVWPDSVVEENNLQVHISALRKVLGSKAIATVPGRGYRFVLPLDSVPATAAAPQPREDSSGLFGRDRDLRDLASLSAAHPLVTVTGAGGVGKTVLARALLANDATSGREAVFVELAAVNDPAQVAATLAAALGVRLAGGDPVASLVGAVAHRKLFVVLDNAEHLVDAAGKLAADILAAALDIRFVVTSQVPLGVRGEHMYRLEPLDCPAQANTASDALGYAAVSLFNARASAADRRFALTDANADAVAAICRQLDGMPLAIELAAARARELGVNMLRESLAQRFRMLTTKARTSIPARQQSLRAALEWSHGLLDDDERALFRRIGVFANGFTLPLALATVGDGDGDWATTDRLAALAERSLVAVSSDEPPRYSLPETMRAYAIEQLDAAGEADEIRSRHARTMHAYFTTLRSGAQLNYADAQRELDDVRDAFHWAREHDPALAIDLAAMSARFTVWDARRTEALGWLASCEPLVDASIPRKIRAEWWVEFARFRLFNRHPEAPSAARHAVELYRQEADDRGLVQALAALVRSQFECSDESRAALAEIDAFVERHPEWTSQTRCLVAGTHAYACLLDNDFATAMRFRKEEASYAAAMGSPNAQNAAETNVIALLRAMGQYDEVQERARTLLARLRGTNETANIAYASLHLVDALLATGKLDEARNYAVEAWHACRAMNLPIATPPAALLAARTGRMRTAARLMGYSRAKYARLNHHPEDVMVVYLEKVEELLRPALDEGELAMLTTQGAEWSDDAAFRAAFESSEG